MIFNIVLGALSTLISILSENTSISTRIPHQCINNIFFIGLGSFGKKTLRVPTYGHFVKGFILPSNPNKGIFWICLGVRKNNKIEGRGQEGRPISQTSHANYSQVRTDIGKIIIAYES